MQSTPKRNWGAGEKQPVANGVACDGHVGRATRALHAHGASSNGELMRLEARASRLLRLWASDRVPESYVNPVTERSGPQVLTCLPEPIRGSRPDRLVEAVGHAAGGAGSREGPQ